MVRLLDYLQLRRDITFNERPFNTIDAMVLSELSYIDWEDIIPDSKEILLPEAIKQYLNRYDEAYFLKKYAFTNQLYPFLCKLKDCPRFAPVHLKDFVYRLNKTKCVQFGAITFEIDRSTIYIAFEGTDSHIIGWKEDFGFTYMEEVTGQRYAKEYLKKVTDKLLIKKNIYVGGHSKGGNLAMYASIENPQIHDLIVRVYNFEGPGFLDSYLSKKDLSSIIDKIYTIVTESSIIGRLLTHPEKLHYVKCDAEGLAQHSLFNWMIDIDDIIPAQALDKKSNDSYEMISSILLSKSFKERKRYTNLLFDVFDELKINTIADLSTLTYPKVKTAAHAFANMTTSEKYFVLQMMLFIIEQSRVVLVQAFTAYKEHIF